MADFSIAKVVSALPGTLVAERMYFVRVGEGFDLVVTDLTAQAKRINASGLVGSVAAGVVSDATIIGDGDAIERGAWNLIDARSADAAVTLADPERVGQVVSIAKLGTFAATITGTTIDGQPDATVADSGVIATLACMTVAEGWESFA